MYKGFVLVQICTVNLYLHHNVETYLKEQTMKAATSVVFSIIWLIVTMMIGFIIVGSLINNANASGAINGTAATHWTTFVTMIWIGFGILALTPLVLVALMFLGLFGGMSR